MNARFDHDEAWRDALAAFYRANCQSQSAINIGVHHMRFDSSDRLTIKALRAAMKLAPVAA